MKLRGAWNGFLARRYARYASTVGWIDGAQDTNSAIPRHRVVVAACAVRDERVLPAKRAADKSIAPGKWHLPGSYVEIGEAPEDELRREILKELSVNIVVERPIFTFIYATAGDAHTIGIAYRVVFIEDTCRLLPLTADIEALAWASATELDRYLEPTDHNFAAAMQALGP